MNNEVFITCAVTGAGDTTATSDLVPITPAQIAEAVAEAADAGAAIAHIHVRDPQSGAPSRDVALYQAAVEEVRSRGTEIVLNLTGGMGAALTLGGPEHPLPVNSERTDLVGAAERLAHVEAIGPEICTIDCGSMNWAGDENYVTIHSQGIIRAMAVRAKTLGVRPELEVFDGGQLDAVRDLIEQELLDEPVLVQLCMGIRYGAAANLATLAALVAQLPPGAVFSSFSVGAMQLPFAALAAIAGGNVRVGLEDNLYLARGQLATNGQLVERAVEILRAMNVRILTPQEVRERLK